MSTNDVEKEENRIDFWRFVQFCNETQCDQLFFLTGGIKEIFIEDASDVDLMVQDHTRIALPTDAILPSRCPSSTYAFGTR